MNQIFVTMKSSSNVRLAYPCNGVLQPVRTTHDGRILSADFFEVNPNDPRGGYYAPCAVHDVEFVYPAV